MASSRNSRSDSKSTKNSNLKKTPKKQSRSDTTGRVSRRRSKILRQKSTIDQNFIKSVDNERILLNKMSPKYRFYVNKIGILKTDDFSLDIVQIPKGTTIFHGWAGKYKNDIPLKMSWFSWVKDIARNHVYLNAGYTPFENKTADELYEYVPTVFAYKTLQNVNLILHKNFKESINLCTFLSGEVCHEQGDEIDVLLGKKLHDLKLKNIHGWLGAVDEAQIFLSNPKLLLSLDMPNVETMRESAWKHIIDRSVNSKGIYDKFSRDKLDDVVEGKGVLEMDFYTDQGVHNVPVITKGKQRYLSIWENKYGRKNFPTEYIEGRISGKIKRKIVKHARNSKKKVKRSSQRI